MLLRLPQPAAAIMSADPGIARVQPASPTSLFLMAVSEGRTTVIATADTGAPIGQYDVIVTPKQRAAPAATRAPRGSARDVQLASHRMVPGARTVTADNAGGRLLLRGSVPNALAAQQVEAIARGIAGEDIQIIDKKFVAFATDLAKATGQGLPASLGIISAQ